MKQDNTLNLKDEIHIDYCDISATGNNRMIGYEFATCKVCNGQKIISELTGLPPQKPKE